MKLKFKIQQYRMEAVEQTVNVLAGQLSKTNPESTVSSIGPYGLTILTVGHFYRLRI